MTDSFAKQDDFQFPVVAFPAPEDFQDKPAGLVLHEVYWSWEDCMSLKVCVRSVQGSCYQSGDSGNSATASHDAVDSHAQSLVRSNGIRMDHGIVARTWKDSAYKPELHVAIQWPRMTPSLHHIS